MRISAAATPNPTPSTPPESSDEQHSIDPETGVERTPGGGLATLFEELQNSTFNPIGDAAGLAKDNATEIGVVGAVGTLGVGTHRAYSSGSLDQALTGVRSTGAAAVSILGESAVAGKNGLKIGGKVIGPMMVAAVAGPAIADLATHVSNGKIPKYRKLTSISSREEREKAEKDNKLVPMIRAAIGGAATGALGLGVFLWKPQFFKSGVGKLVPGVASVADAQSGIASLPPGAWKKITAIGATIGAVGGVTAVPGAQSASKYFSIVDDFETITESREWAGK